MLNEVMVVRHFLLIEMEIESNGFGSNDLGKYFLQKGVTCNRHSQVSALK